MPHDAFRSLSSLNRRAALTGAGAAAVVSLGHLNRAAAQEATPNALANHPNVGVWMIDSPIGRAIAVYSDDGSVVTALPATQAGPQGVTFSSTQVGTWEPTGERSTHLPSSNCSPTERVLSSAPSRSTPTRRSVRTANPSPPRKGRR